MINAAAAPSDEVAPTQDGYGSTAAGRRALITTAHHSKAADLGTKRDTG
jgi:hypothetical protein